MLACRGSKFKVSPCNGMAMTQVLWLLAVQGVLGAFDTVYYHEWRARLPSLGHAAHAELSLHAGRDFVYALLFAMLPVFEWHGLWSALLALLLAIEVVLTLWDFIVEDWARKSLGGLYPGERVTHAVMGILYGAMLAYLVPNLVDWWRTPAALVPLLSPIPTAIRFGLWTMAVGVLLSGLRDMLAALDVPYSSWPWCIEGRHF